MKLKAYYLEQSTINEEIYLNMADRIIFTKI